MSNILEKIKSLDQSKITSDTIRARVEKALTYYDDRNDLTPEEIATYTKVYDNAFSHIEKNLEAERVAAEKEQQEAELNQQKATALAEISAMQFPHLEVIRDKKIDSAEVDGLVNSFNENFTSLQKDPLNESLKNKVIKLSSSIVEKVSAYEAHVQEQQTKAANEKAAKENKLKQQKMIENMEFPHEVYLKEIGKTPADFSGKMRSNIASWKNIQLGRLAKAPENEVYKKSAISSSEKLRDKMKEEFEAKQNPPAQAAAPAPKPNDPPKQADPKPQGDLALMGESIDKEFAALIKNEPVKMSLGDVKKNAPTAYKLLFDTYEEGSPNGIETTNFSLIETEKEVFTLSKC